MDSLAGYVSDDELAAAALRELGWQTETVSWRDKTVDWNDFAAVVIRTTWDYQKSPDEFLKVLRTIDQSRARLENSLQIVRWNLSKLYLRELAAKLALLPPLDEDFWSDIEKARAITPQGGRILVTGSLYLLGEVKKLLQAGQDI